MFGEVLCKTFTAKKRKDKVGSFLSLKLVNLLSNDERKRYLMYFKRRHYNLPF